MANLLTNPNFSAPPLPTSLLIGTGHPGKSAAQSWTTWNNSAPPKVCAYTSTAILQLSGVDRLVNPPHNNPQPFCFGANEFVRVPFQAEQVLEVCTNGSSNGIVQVFAPPNQGPAHTLSSVWVFVLRGAVGMGTGNGGNTQQDAVSTKTYQWEQLKARNGVSPANEFIVYSATAASDGAWFFVGDATVNPV